MALGVFVDTIWSWVKKDLQYQTRKFMIGLLISSNFKPSCSGLMLSDPRKVCFDKTFSQRTQAVGQSLEGTTRERARQLGYIIG